VVVIGQHEIMYIDERQPRHRPPPETGEAESDKRG
jgi:hypothetical protein